MLAHLAEGVFGLDRDGCFTFLNPTACQLLGYPDETTLLGRPAHEVLHHSKADQRPHPHAECAVSYTLQTGDAVQGHEDLFWRRDGSTLDVLLQAAPLHDEAGNRSGVVVAFQDISERKRLERELNHSHRLMHYIIEHNRSAVAVHDTQLRYIYVSQKYLDDFELEERAIIGKHHYAIFPDLPEKWRRVHQRVLQGEILSGEDDLYLRADGRRYWTQWECRPWRLEDGTIGGIIVYTEVINQRKEAEERIQFNLNLQRVIAEISADFVRADENRLDSAIDETLAKIGRLFSADRSYLFLFSPDQQTMHNTHEWCAAGVTSQRPRTQNMSIATMPWFTQRVLQGQHVHIRDVAQLPAAAVEERKEFLAQEIRSLICLPITNEHGVPTGFIGLDQVHQRQTWSEQQISMLRVIGEIIGNTIHRIEARRELARREEKYRLLADNVNDVIWEFDLDLNHTYVSPSLEKLFGYRPEEVIGRSAHPFLTDESARIAQHLLTESLAAVERGEGPVTFRRELEMVRRDGSRLWTEINGRIICDEHGYPQGVMGITRDISERVSLLRRLTESNLKLEAACRAKNDFLNAVSHDLRTPLNAILGFNELLLDSSLDSAQRHYLKLSRSAGHHLLGLIDSLLDLSKLESGRVELSREVIELHPFLKEQMALLETQAANKALALRWTIDERVPERVVGDPIRFGQVLFNLVINAIKFTAHGSVSVTLAPYDEQRLIVAVEDTGAGIPATLQANIFEPFQRGSLNAQKEHGSGLGLAICRELAHLMGGELWLQSTPGVGSTFYFTALLPAVASSAAAPSFTPDAPAPASAPEPHQQHASAPTSAALPGAGLHVLVAEDEPTNALLIRALLEKCGATVTMTEDGQAALKAWQQRRPDLLLLDYQMPILNGPETISAVRAEEAASTEPPTLIAMLSAHATEDARQACAQAGADTYLTKPIQRHALGALLEWAQQEASSTRARSLR
nr:PAS domain S-box protein [Halorhodospira abdelmalekii]